MIKNLKMHFVAQSILIFMWGIGPSLTLAQPKAPTAQAPTEDKQEIKQAIPKLVWIQLSGTLSDKTQAFEFEPQAPDDNLQQILNGIRKIPDDPQPIGLVIYLKGVKLKLHQAQQLYDAIREIRQKNSTLKHFLNQ